MTGGAPEDGEAEDGVAGEDAGGRKEDDLMAGLDEEETPITKAIRLGVWP